jgi:hypothetical protein
VTTRSMQCQKSYVSGYRAGTACPYKASEVIATAVYSLQVCGYHARQFHPDVRYPLTFNLTRIRAWQIDNLARLAESDR